MKGQTSNSLLRKNTTSGLRIIARRLGIGRALLKVHQIKEFTITQALQVSVAKRKYLTRIMEASPLASGDGGIELRMLLQHKRIYEGIWSLYSFAYFCNKPIRIVVHDDGTLTESDIAKLSHVLPGCQVITRPEADAVVMDYLKTNGLINCARLRQSERYKFALRLFDSLIFSKNSSYISADSDVLFFSFPEDLIAGMEKSDDCTTPINLYSVDGKQWYPYVLELSEIERLIGKPVISQLNAGLLRIHQQSINLWRVEKYLKHPDFWSDKGDSKRLSEQTIRAMELTLEGASPLPPSYAICPIPEEPPRSVSGHYCGGGYRASLYYTLGLPYLAKILLP